MDGSLYSDFSCSDRILSETQACSLIRRGGILLFPTETFYAIGTYFLSRPALSTICAIKERPKEKPLPLAAADFRQVEAICRTESFPRSLFFFWPASLTLVLPLREPEHLPSCIRNSREEAAVRVSPHPTVMSLAASGPITVSSANRAGRKPARSIKTLDPALLERLAVSGLPWGMVDGQQTTSSLPSTIVRPVEDSPGTLLVLRKGAFPLARLLEAGFILLDRPS